MSLVINYNFYIRPLFTQRFNKQGSGQVITGELVQQTITGVVGACLNESLYSFTFDREEDLFLSSNTSKYLKNILFGGQTNVNRLSR